MPAIVSSGINKASLLVHSVSTVQDDKQWPIKDSTHWRGCLLSLLSDVRVHT